jgi:uncharacterized membrane protein HdeD (DUF308 family)
MLTEERMVVREGTRYWWVFLLSGLAWLIVAWIVLRANATSLVAVGLWLGVIFVVAGFNEAFMAGLVSGGWKVWHYVMSAIFILGGLWAFIRPINTFFALASVLGLILFFYGTFEIIRAFGERGVYPYWWLSLTTGILLILVAFWVSASDREFALRAYLILFWAGFMALFKGISQLMLAYGIRHAGKRAGADLLAA